MNVRDCNGRFLTGTYLKPCQNWSCNFLQKQRLKALTMLAKSSAIDVCEDLMYVSAYGLNFTLNILVSFCFLNNFNRFTSKFSQQLNKKLKVQN